MNWGARDTSNQVLLANSGTGAAPTQREVWTTSPLPYTCQRLGDTAQAPPAESQVINHAFEAPFNLFSWSVALSYASIAQLRTDFPSCYSCCVTQPRLPPQPRITFWAGTPAESWSRLLKTSKEVAGWGKITNHVSIVADARWNQLLSCC